MPATSPTSARRAISPRARRLAHERGIALELLAGTGPSGRITAADVVAFVPRPAAPAATGGPQASALGTTIALAAMQAVLTGFGDAATPFSLEDVVLRAAGCALDDVSAAGQIDGTPVALERRQGQLVFSHIRRGSLGPLRARRLAAIEAAQDQSAQPAALSLRLLEASDVRPVVMPLLPGRAMRLVLAAGTGSGECLLSFDASQIDEEAATELLARFKAYLEVPLRLLA